MYVETAPNRNSPSAVLLREGWCGGARVRKRTLPTGPQRKPTSCAVRSKAGVSSAPHDAFTIERSLLTRPRRRSARHDPALGPGPAKRSPEHDWALAMVVERLLHPASKLATARLWHTATLTQELDLGDADEDALYEAMDRPQE